MWPFTAREPRPLPASATELLAEIPPEFVDDGCSSSPDQVFGFWFRWACRIHDWRFCTRCHPPGSMTRSAEAFADLELRGFIRDALPWRWRWVRWIYYRAVRLGGPFSFDSCGPEPQGVEPQQKRLGLCRHGMPMPAWMER